MPVSSHATRRKFLRGTLQGISVTVGVPLLECFLNSNGTALASGAPLPVAFGTWFWGCGLSPNRWVPKTTGANYELGIEMQSLQAFKSRMNVYSGLTVHIDGKPKTPHGTGPAAIFRGVAPTDVPNAGPSLDSVIADTIGRTTRFRSIEVSCYGGPTSFSSRGGVATNPAETSAAALYARLFGPEFVDPNADNFVVDPMVLARHSVLSGVTEQRRDFARMLGASDRARLDEYFTSTRALEQQLQIMMQKPTPMPSCTRSERVNEKTTTSDLDVVIENHKFFARLLAHAVACDQTRVFNVVFCSAISPLRKAGETTTHHILTHEEAVDPRLGYQPRTAEYGIACMEGFRTFLEVLDGIQEGSGTLLDRSIVMTGTCSGYAKMHSVENIPMLTAGGGAGRLKTGIHVSSPGDPTTRLGLTLQQVLGVQAAQWGAESMRTAKTITEVLA